MSSCDNSNIRKNYIVTSTEIDILSACTGFYTNNIYPCESDTINIQSDIVSANTLNSSVYLSGGTNLIDIFTSFNTYVTGITYDNSNNLTLERNDNVTLSTNISVFSGLTINGILSACTGIYTSNLYGCSPITVNDDLILTSGLTLNTIINDDALTQILVRDNVTGRIKYRSVSSITPDTNTYVTGTTFSSNEAILTRNDDFEVLKLSGGSNVTLSNPSLNQILIDVTIPTDTNTYVTGGTYNESTDTITLTRNDNVTIEITGVTDTFTTGGTYSNSTKLITFTRNDGNIYTVDLSSLDINDTYVTGFTYDNINTFTITRNDDVSISTSISTLSGITYYGNGIGLTNIPISGVTNLQSELDNKLNVSLFDTYTGDTQIILNTKISGATNLSTEGIFAQINGLDLEFKGITSTGGTLSISSDSNSVNLETILPQDVFVYSGNADVINSTLSFLNTTGGTFTVTNSAALFSDNDINVTGGTYNPSDGCITFTTNSGTSFNVCGFLTGYTNYYVTGGTYNDVTDTITLTRNDGGTVDITGVTDSYVSGGTYNVGTQSIDFNGNSVETTFTVDLSSLVNSVTGDTFVTGTTFSANEAILTRNDGFDVLKLSGGSNVILSNPSLNEILIDVTIPPDTNTFVTGGTYNDITNTITLTRNDAVTIDITGITDTYVTGVTLNGNTLELERNEGLPTLTVDLSPINTNYYVTGGTYNSGTTSIDYVGTVGFPPFSVDVSELLDNQNTYLTAFTYDNANTFTIVRNDNQTFNATINSVSGLTINGDLNVTGTTNLDVVNGNIFSGGTYYGDGSNLSGITTVDNYTTGATLVGDILIFDRTDTLSAYTVSLSSITVTGTTTTEIFLGDEEFITNNAGRSVLTSTSTGFLSFAGTGQPDDAGVSFKIPLDYDSEPQFAVQWTMDGTSSTANTVNYNLNITTGNTSTINDHSVISETISIVDEAYSGTAWRILQTSFSSSTLNYSAGDYIHVELERNPANVNDTMIETAFVSGLIFKYKANK